MKFLDRLQAKRLLRKIDERKDTIHNYLLTIWYKEYGYFPDWDLGGEFAGDRILGSLYLELEEIIKAQDLSVDN